MTLKKTLTILLWALILFIFCMGVYSAVQLFSEIRKIDKEGIEATAVITKKWRGKCGSGYGNSATFVTNIDGKELTFTSSCNVPNEVEVGDKYYLKYIKDDPSENRVLFNRKAP